MGLGFFLILTLPWMLFVYGLFSVAWGVFAKYTPTGFERWDILGKLIIKVIPFCGGIVCLIVAAYNMGWF